MNAKDIIEAIYLINPNAEFSFNEADLETLQWHNETKPLSNATILETIKNNKAAKAQVELNKATKRDAALAKLLALGLDVDDLAALGL